MRRSNRTSGALLIDYIWDRVEASAPERREERHRIAVMAQDVWIKCRSYAILNKIFFWLSLIGAICIAAWPAAVAFEPMRSWLGAAVVQTVVTGLTGLFVYVYQQYKRYQSATESILREIAYGDEPFSELRSQVIGAMSAIDKGFHFSRILDRYEASGNGSAAK